jgi:hypothetical protein
MARLSFVLALTALAACSEASVPGGPADADIRKAILRFYAAPGGPLSQYDPNNMKYHAVVSTGRCETMDPGFVCLVTFERSGEGKARRFVWLTRTPEGWKAEAVTAGIP